MSAAPFRVGVVVSSRSWSRRLHAFIADHVPGVELTMVRDQRAALDAAPHVLLIDDSTPWMTQSFVELAGAKGIRLVGVYDRTDGGAGRTRLAEFGLTHLIEEAMPSDDIVFLLDRLRPADGEGPFEPGPRDNDPGRETTDGVVVAVGGASGSGARELAIGLAAEWAAQHRRTLLVDANETTPGVARRLGLGLYPHILSAIDRVGVDGVNGVDSALADQVGRPPFDVLVGLPTPRDWDRLLANDVETLLAVCRDGWDRVVVTTGPLIEDLQRWGDRFGVSRRVLGVADAVVGCCEPSPRGVLRYLDWIAEASRLRPSVTTVLNKTPRSRRAAAEVVRQLVDVGGTLMEGIVEVPFDRAVAVAEWDGVLVRRGPFRRAMASVISNVDDALALTQIEVMS